MYKQNETKLKKFTSQIIAILIYGLVPICIFGFLIIVFFDKPTSYPPCIVLTPQKHLNIGYLEREVRKIAIKYKISTSKRKLIIF